MDSRIVIFLLFLCLSTGYTMKNDDANDDMLDQLKETDALKEAPKVQADPVRASYSSTSHIYQFEDPAHSFAFSSSSV
ncbi:hypothetical protein ACROYT_G027569 [Oculina patagonica]